MAPISVAPTGGYLTTGDVAKRICGTTQHVRELIRSGRLAAIDIANGDSRPRFRVSEDSLTRFLRDAAVKPTAQAVA